MISRNLRFKRLPSFYERFHWRKTKDAGSQTTNFKGSSHECYLFTVEVLFVTVKLLKTLNLSVIFEIIKVSFTDTLPFAFSLA